MMRIISTLSVVAFASLAFGAGQASAQQPPAPPPPAVHVGQAAPDFELSYMEPAADNRVQTKKVKLSDFKGKKNVVLAFFPAAFSPG